MKAGAKTRPWRVEDTRYLLDNAGRIPKAEICERLNRTDKAVEHMAAKLRRQGYAVDFRCYQSEATICPHCGRKTYTAKFAGMCRPCALNRRLNDIEGRIATLLLKIPPEERNLYEKSEALRQSYVFDPMPDKPTYTGKPSRYRLLKDADEYDRAMEEWLIKGLWRKVRAAQKRKERIEHKVNGLC